MVLCKFVRIEIATHFTSLTASDTVVISGGFVATHFARDECFCSWVMVDTVWWGTVPVGVEAVLDADVTGGFMFTVEEAGGREHRGSGNNEGWKSYRNLWNFLKNERSYGLFLLFCGLTANTGEILFVGEWCHERCTCPTYRNHPVFHARNSTIRPPIRSTATTAVNSTVLVLHMPVVVSHRRSIASTVEDRGRMEELMRDWRPGSRLVLPCLEEMVRMDSLIWSRMFWNVPTSQVTVTTVIHSVLNHPPSKSIKWRVTCRVWQ